MALRVGLNRLNSTALRSRSFNNQNKSVISLLDTGVKRWKSSDQGDVIGIDLGTTNSCVAIMVRQ